MKAKRDLLIALVVLSALLCVALAARFLRVAFDVPSTSTVCYARTGEAIQSNTPGFSGCIEEDARVFLDRDYAEAKDLSKAFLTLLTAVLVASITFSEKIVDLGKSGWWARGAMIACWVMLLAAIAAAGSGLALMSIAAGWASYQPQTEFRLFEARAVTLFVGAGFAFGAGMVSLFVAGVISLVERHGAAPANHPP